MSKRGDLESLIEDSLPELLSQIKKIIHTEKE